MPIPRPTRLLALAPALALTGCLTPNTVVTYTAPGGGLTYTVETHHGLIRRKLDYTSVYAHISIGGHTERRRVLRGIDIEETHVSFRSPTDVDLCIPADGSTLEYRSHLTFQSNGITVDLHNHLHDDCKN